MLHFEILIEDASGKVAVERILPKIEGEFTSRVISYRGIGRLPGGLAPGGDAKKRILLDQLPRLISGYGKAFAADPKGYNRVVIVICDLDNRDQAVFIDSIQSAVGAHWPLPVFYVCLAIEEGEAWLLGDRDAVLAAYPKANIASLHSYVYDSICGTWEKLADVVYPGGSKELKKGNFAEIGKQKSIWAKQITPHIVVDRNASPSFQYFVKIVRDSIEADLID